MNSRKGDALRILSVEDEPLNRLLLRAVLERCDDARLRQAELIEAGTLAEGRQRLGESTPDVVLLDRRLPDGDGLDLARENRSSSPGDRPYFVAVTADAIPSARAAAVAAGCDAIVVKPYLPAELMSVISDLLDSSLRGVSGSTP